MWSIISSVISITYSITIMRKIRRFYSVWTGLLIYGQW
jgi:hypothetical protein